MPKYQLLTPENLPQHLDETAIIHHGHGWDTLNVMHTTAKKLGIKLRPADVVIVYGVDRKTAVSWLVLLNQRNLSL